MDEGHKTRIALNEATYRKVNEAMRADNPENRITFVCECGRLGCNELIRLSRAEYERVRSNARRFAIVPGPRRPRGRGRRRALRRLRGHSRSTPPSTTSSGPRTRTGPTNPDPEALGGARYRERCAR